jgi:exopolyphosphatase/pppGpp-phosphohydrolase
LYANNLYGGIEIGGKGIKTSIIDVKNFKKGDYQLINFWTENVCIAKGISQTGKLAKEDIENTTNVVEKNYKKLIDEYQLNKDKIFIVISSGVGMAINTSDLVLKLNELLEEDVEIITANLESKLLYKGSIPTEFYKNSIILDIGGGNTKGGYVEVSNGNMVFFPINMNLGTITLTEKINKENDDVTNYTKEIENYSPKLDILIDKMYKERAHTKEKSKVFISGGAVWSFYTLFKGPTSDNFASFSLDEVKQYHKTLINSFSEYEKIAENNKDVSKVLKTYSQKHLIAANVLLIKTLENLTKLKEKEIFFVKNGYLSWLVSYIIDASDGSKPIY